MNNAFKTGASGLKAHQTRIDNIANNIANVQTTGFKKTDVEFEDLLYTQFDANDLSKVQGHGVKVQGTPIDFTAGSLMQSDQALDIAIVGDAFFALLKLITALKIGASYLVGQFITVFTRLSRPVVGNSQFHFLTFAVLFPGLSL